MRTEKNGRGGVAGVGCDQPGAGAGGAFALLPAQEAAGERARLPSPPDGDRRSWCWWWLAAARPRATNAVVSVDLRGLPALRRRRAAAPWPRRARRRPPLQVWVRDDRVIEELVTRIFTNN